MATQNDDKISVEVLGPVLSVEFTLEEHPARRQRVSVRGEGYNNVSVSISHPKQLRDVAAAFELAAQQLEAAQSKKGKAAA